MNRAVSMEDLMRAAEKLPRKSRGSYYRVALDPPLFARYPYYTPGGGLHNEVPDLAYLEFHAKEVEIEGVECMAWFYHDVLVRVCV